MKFKAFETQPNGTETGIVAIEVSQTDKYRFIIPNAGRPQIPSFQKTMIRLRPSFEKLPAPIQSKLIRRGNETNFPAMIFRRSTLEVNRGIQIAVTARSAVLRAVTSLGEQQLELSTADNVLKIATRGFEHTHPEIDSDITRKHWHIVDLQSEYSSPVNLGDDVDCGTYRFWFAP